MTEYLFPKRIMAYEWVQNADNLLIKQDLQIGLVNNRTTTFKKGGYIILDFGKELCGSIRILTVYSKESKVHIRFGESLTECCSDAGG